MATRDWWVPVLIGLLSVIVGVVVLIKPSDSLATLAVMTGVFVLIFGLMEVISALFFHPESRGVVALVGALSAIVGIALIRHPVKGVTFVALLLGIWLVVIGLVRVIAAFGSQEDRAWRFAVGLVELVAGIVIVASPNIGYATLALLVGISLLLNGGSLIALGWLMHTANRAADVPARAPARAS